MIESIRSHYADVPILCVTPHSATSYLQSCLNMLKEQVKADKNVYMANPMTGIITTIMIWEHHGTRIIRATQNRNEPHPADFCHHGMEHGRQNR